MPHSGAKLLRQVQSLRRFVAADNDDEAAHEADDEADFAATEEADYAATEEADYAAADGADYAAADGADYAAATEEADDDDGTADVGSINNNNSRGMMNLF